MSCIYVHSILFLYRFENLISRFRHTPLLLMEDWSLEQMFVALKKSLIYACGNILSRNVYNF